MEAEAQKEEEHFSSKNRPFDVIISTSLHIETSTNYPVFEFKTRKRQYILVIAVENIKSLGWKECHAIQDGMKISARGTDMDDAIFASVLQQAKVKYGQAHGPDLHENVLLGFICPFKGTHDKHGDHTINQVTMSFDKDGDLVVQAKTEVGNNYNIFLQLLRKGGGLSVLDCLAVCDILAFTEPGDVLPPNHFIALGAVLYKKYNYVNAKKSDNGTTYSLTILASKIENPVPMNSMLLNAVESVKQEMEQGISVSGNIECPYGGITYTKILKEGGQAVVYAGKRKDQDIAVKVFLEQAGQLISFKTELRLLLKMSKHRNVVEIIDFFENPSPALVMNLIQGQDLGDYLAKNGSCNNDSGRRMALGIAEGIYHLHRHGIVHRDIKSGNIVRKNDGTPVIIDLGIGSTIERRASSSENQEEARMRSAQKTIAVKGSYPWMAPEMILEQMWSEKTDVYAFGIVLWEIFSGAEPFVDLAALTAVRMALEIANGARPQVSKAVNADPEMKSLMQACWDKDPSKRPSMKVIVDVLRGNDPREVFKTVDSDGNGNLDFGEFVTFLQKYAPGKVTPAQMYSLFEAIDEDKSGGISFDEFEVFWRQVEVLGFGTAVSRAKEAHALMRKLSDTRITS